MLDVRDVAKYFLAKPDDDDGREMTHLKLQKLLYYAQGFHLALEGEPLFGASIEAWAHGPVVPEVYSTYKSYGSNSIEPDTDFDPLTVPGMVRELLDEVYEVYGQFSGWRLREMTHAEEPWKRHAHNSGEISQEELLRFFKTRLTSGESA